MAKKIIFETFGHIYFAATMPIHLFCAVSAYILWIILWEFTGIIRSLSSFFFHIQLEPAASENFPTYYLYSIVCNFLLLVRKVAYSFPYAKSRTTYIQEGLLLPPFTYITTMHSGQRTDTKKSLWSTKLGWSWTNLTLIQFTSLRVRCHNIYAYMHWR
jgi:hypothetical protein